MPWGILKGFHQFAAAFRVIVVRVLTLGIGVMHDQAEAWSRVSDRGVFQHCLVTVTVAEAGDRTAADELVDTDGLSLLVVHKQIIQRFDQHWPTWPELVFCATS